MQAGSRHQGFALLMVLGLLALLGLGLTAAGPAWREQILREREAEWLRVGTMYAQALDSYVKSSPGSMKRPPEDLGELLLDTRFISVRRHLREAYADPLMPPKPWQLLRDDDGRIVGVFSNAQDEPFIHVAPAGSRVKLRPQGIGYSRWAFVIDPHPVKTSNPHQ